MTTLRNIRALLAEAHHELWCLADRAVAWADRRWNGQGYPDSTPVSVDPGSPHRLTPRPAE